MDLQLPQPGAHYGVAKLTVRHGEEWVDIGPSLVATYDSRTFEVLLPIREVLQPYCWERIRYLGQFTDPAQALERFFKYQWGLLVARLEENDGGGAVALEIPARKPEMLELRELEMGA